MLDEPDDGVPCSGAKNPSATLGKVYFAQTHALSPGHPLFFLIAERPALLEVQVTGTGQAPEIKVTAQAKGKSLGTLCLAGPRELPASIDDSVHRRDDRYTVTLPSAWLTAELSVEITAGEATRALSAKELTVGHAPELNMVLFPVDVLNYNDAKKDSPIPDGWLANLER